MPRAYSIDLRERVVRAVEAGQSCRSAAAQFAVSASSAIKWVSRWRSRGDVSPGSSRGRIRSPLFAHRSWLLELVAAEPDLTLAEIQRRLAGRGLRIGLGSIWRFFEREGVSFKKNRARQRTGSARRRQATAALEKASGPT